MGPCFAGAGIDDRVDAVLFEHDVALDGWGRLIFSGFDDPIVMRGAWTEDFEDHNGLIDDGRSSVDWGAHDHAVGIADVALRDLKFEVAAEELTRLAAEAGR